MTTGDRERTAEMEIKTLRSIVERVPSGVRDIAAAIDSPILMVTRGWDLLEWEYVQAPGMVLFRRMDRTSPGRSAEMEALRTRQREAQGEVNDLLAASYHDGDARRNKEAAQNRANAIGREIAELRRREDGASEAQPDPRIVAAVLVVNAPESQRVHFEREALETVDGRYPVDVIMNMLAPAVKPQGGGEDFEDIPF